MTTVKDIARYVRSKNAGPFWVTIEIFCETEEAYEMIKKLPEHYAAENFGTVSG